MADQQAWLDTRQVYMQGKAFNWNSHIHRVWTVNFWQSLTVSIAVASATMMYTKATFWSRLTTILFCWILLQLIWNLLHGRNKFPGYAIEFKGQLSSSCLPQLVIVSVTLRVLMRHNQVLCYTVSSGWIVLHCKPCGFEVTRHPYPNLHQHWAHYWL